MKKEEVDELERAARIQRDVERAYGYQDIKILERKMIGRLWGRPRRKMQGWPRGRS